MLIGTIHMTPTLQEGGSQRVLNECVDQIVSAEELGYYSAWVSEHHFASFPQYYPYGYDCGDYVSYDTVPDALTMLSWVAARTSRIRLGTGVVCLPYQHPLQVAERAAILDNLSGGRVELGIGRGGGWRSRQHSALRSTNPRAVDDSASRSTYSSRLGATSGSATPVSSTLFPRSG